MEETGTHRAIWGKSIGECSVVPSAGAIANAVASEIGCEVHRLPLKPDTVLELLARENETVEKGWNHLMRFEDKVAAITGAGQGLGVGFKRHLPKRGAVTILIGRDRRAKLQAVAEKSGRGAAGPL